MAPCMVPYPNPWIVGAKHNLKVGMHRASKVCMLMILREALTTTRTRFILVMDVVVGIIEG
jgi:hypothetical protein